MSGSSNALLDAIANPRQVDVAGAYGTANRLAQGIWANRLAQSQQAAGQAALGAIGPDGTFNAQRLNQNLAADPSTAMSAQESMQRGSTNATTDFDLHMKRLTGLNAAAMALTAQYPNGVPQDAVNKEIDRVAPTYGISPQEAAALKSQFPGDPVGNSRMLIRNGIANLTAQESLHASRPGATTVDTGPAVVGANVAPAGADQPGALAVPAGQGVPKGVSPETAAAETPVYKKMPDGTYQPVLDPRSNRPGLPGRAVPDYTGQPNPLLGGLPNPQEGNAPPAASPALSAPPQGQPEAVAADVGKFKQDQFAIPAGQQNVQSLQKAQVALEASNTGRSSEGVHNMLATMQTLGIPTFGMADDVASYDLAHKYLLDYARKSGAAAHSDLQLQSSEGANASTGINQQAALDVVHTNIGRERQAIAQNMEAAQTGIGYGAHTSKFSTATDPRGFALDAYKPADLNPNDPKSMVGKMTSAERAKFYKSAGIAQRLGLLNPRAP